jgi:hypothetical protein
MHLRGCTSLDPLDSPLGDAGLFGHIGLGQLQIETAACHAFA